MQKLVIFLLLLTVAINATGQKKWQKSGLKPVYPVCYAADRTEKSYIPPSKEVMNLLKSAEKKSEFIVDYNYFPQEAIDAFDHAVGLWERIIESPVPIHIEANWTSRGENVLGSCGPSDYEMNFEGAPRKNVYYPIAAVEKIMGEELTGSERPDMNAYFNKDILWYFGTDGQTPDSLYDFVSVVLHEIGHGLGFTGFFYVDNRLGGYSYWEQGDITSFDQLVGKSNGELLTDTTIYENPSAALYSALVSGFLYAQSPSAFVNDYPRLYVPFIWDDGSSIYHLNDATYSSNDPNSLMTHAMGRGEATHDPGPITTGILDDIGWKNMQIDFTQLKDMEEVDTIHFSAEIESDYEIDTTSLFVVYSTDSFKNQPDTIPLLPTGNNLYEAQLLPLASANYLNYYISAGDIKNRTFRQPTEAPNEFFTINFGEDNLKPEIEHEPIPYFFTANNKLNINATVNDNLGIDTVYVEYAINGVPQPSFGLLPGTASNIFVGEFEISETQLEDGDEITYKIVARDASVAQNTSMLPAKNNFNFRVEKVYNPISGYINNFNNSNPDFILTDFDIYPEINFKNGALHSPHPYPSPDQDDTDFNFTTILKYPIILNENAKMTFDEIVLVEPGEFGTVHGDFDFWDYVIVEGRKKSEETWLPLADAYDARANSTWEENFNLDFSDMNSTTIGQPEWYVNREINMLENSSFSAGDTILIRFRLYSDPYAHGWGWAIDNLRIQTPVSSPQPILSPGNITAYPNPFQDEFNVRIEPKSPVKKLQLDVYNMFGQKVKSVEHQNLPGRFSIKISLQNQADGIYLLSVKENGKQILTQKLIKKSD
ncbi:T9SS type A sorting domain-containing protein [Tangfeifania diversioriginum]|nr:T9SS type A sorting domain-containing protein [Tangfeifania diversioriginum]